MDWKLYYIVYNSKKTCIAISEKHVWHIAQKNTHCTPRKTRLASQNIWNCNQESIEMLLPHIFGIYCPEKRTLQSQKNMHVLKLFIEHYFIITSPSKWNIHTTYLPPPRLVLFQCDICSRPRNTVQSGSARIVLLAILVVLFNVILPARLSW